MQINFKEIRAYENDQRNGFEELVCQIAHRLPPGNAKEFRRIEGSGGDGGVEALWFLDDGSKIGYQAKYFTATKDINWQHVDNSVETALDTHQELKEYVVAFACNLTGRSGSKGHGKTGWEHWDTHRKKWRKWAKKKDIDISFKACTKSDIVNSLTDPSLKGLAEFWFNKKIFTQNWFEKWFEVVKEDLDERYHPEDHVEINLSKTFEGLARSKTYSSNLKKKLNLCSISNFETNLNGLNQQPNTELINSCDSSLEGIRNHITDDEINLDTKLKIPLLKVKIEDAEEKVSLLEKWLRDFSRNIEDDNSEIRNNINDTRKELTKIKNDIVELKNYVTGKEVSVDQTRSAIIFGESGTGKSHIMANAVTKSIEKNRPSILFLGQYFGQNDLWKTFLNKLDLSNLEVEEFLGALNSAAETYQHRCIILIDALDEVRDLNNLRDNIAGFCKRISKYKYLAVSLSLRSEYKDILIPSPLMERSVNYECRGFETIEEQERAAKIYLDKKGISRPVFPWLAPEFQNPLFLRTCAITLDKTGKSSFPKGLKGIKKILGFYLESLEIKIRKDYPNADLQENFVAGLCSKLASKMANNKTTKLPKRKIKSTISSFLGTKGPNQNKSWYRIFCSEGLLTKYPKEDSSDPFSNITEEVKFAYSRYSDHLIVEALLEGVEDPDVVFKEELNFLFENEKLKWEWNNLIPSLSIQFPERFSKEFVDALPGGIEEWWEEPIVRRSFKDSLLRRSKKSFTSRTRNIFNKLGDFSYRDPRFEILIRLAPIEGHPWNATSTDSVLKGFDIAHRDALWTTYLSNISQNERHVLNDLIDWVLHADITKTNSSTLELVAIILSWSFSSTNRPLRDRATNAVSRIIVNNPQTFTKLIKAFEAVDDLYVLERIYAAGYGAVCQGNINYQLKEIAQKVYSVLFEDNNPPQHLLLRDYGRGILEFAKKEDYLSENISCSQYRPPYKSEWPLPQVSEKEIEQIATSRNGDAILHSVYSGLADFGRYTVNSAIDNFTNVLLTEDRPLNKDEKLELFYKEVEEWEDVKCETFINLVDIQEQFQESQHHSLNLNFEDEDWNQNIKIDISQDEELDKQLKQTEESFLGLLDDDEIGLYEKLAIPKLFPERTQVNQKNIHDFDGQFAKRWIVKRAYELGWNAELFPNESSVNPSSSRPEVERVGKKYQWIAYYELLAILSDYFWMKKNIPVETFKYDNPCQAFSIFRDIEPTIFEDKTSNNIENDNWWFPYEIDFNQKGQRELANWPFGKDDIINTADLIEINKDSNEWLTLHSFYSKDKKQGEEITSKIKQTAFVRLVSILVDSEEADDIFGLLKGQTLTSGPDWHPTDIIDEPYLFEYPWRNTWCDVIGSWRKRRHGIGEFDHLDTTIMHSWESSIDKSLTTSHQVCIPNYWIGNKLGLKPNPKNYGQFTNKQEEVVFIDPSYGRERSSAGLIKKNIFLDFLDKHDLECFWLIAGEKAAFPKGNYDKYSRRYHNAIYRYNMSGGWKRKKWYDDDQNGLLDLLEKKIDR